MNKIVKLFFVLFLTAAVSGCAGLNAKGGLLDGLDKSAVSVLSRDRLAILGLGERERQILEKNLQFHLVKVRSKTYKDNYPRDDGSILGTVAVVGRKFVPQTPLGLSCRKLSLRVTPSIRQEAYAGEGLMCLDKLLNKTVWERRSDVKVK